MAARGPSARRAGRPGQGSPHDPASPGPPASFRAASPGDAEAVLALMQEYYAFDHLAWDAARARAALARLLADPGLGQAWVAEAAGQPVGYCVMTLGYSLEFHGRDAFLDELYLREACRGQGLGRAAIALVEAAARSRGVRVLHLEVERANVRAQAVYRRLGYADHDRYLMTKWL